MLSSPQTAAVQLLKPAVHVTAPAVDAGTEHQQPGVRAHGHARLGRTDYLFIRGGRMLVGAPVAAFRSQHGDGAAPAHEFSRHW